MQEHNGDVALLAALGSPVDTRFTTGLQWCLGAVSFAKQALDIEGADLHVHDGA